MDPLSDVLRTLRLSGGVFLDASFTAPWCILAQMSPEDCAPMPPPAQLIAYHYVVAGRFWLQVDGEPPIRLEAGDIVLLPRNDAHRLGSTLDLPATDAGPLVQPPGADGLACISHGGGGEPVRLLCGFLGSAMRDSPFLASLPRVLAFGVGDGASGDWIASSFRFAARELRGGSVTMLSRLSELLFLEAARRYLGSLGPGQSGWLAGLRDPVIGRALALMHGAPADPWTAAALARAAGLSRSAFAERFAKLIGESPMGYLGRWRLSMAADRLRQGQPITRIAHETGYGSVAAFTRAFSRAHGVPPAAWRASGMPAVQRASGATH
ncbi:AraC family transcriptional regulator [Plastoroseomonas hellenica]|uniref:AraC family transcriptional regulator n=1 Tax=Plastoroseomonas hellenica TaxID=2687306 RepID=UPI001BAC5C1D|nr:AraC family transcriptional regulator [Plastoroseomonas hellenica]MBR0647144.1 AraC family transcriptional regulator [Plastoroseomonas hellenica]